VWEWGGAEQERNPLTAPDRCGPEFKSARSTSKTAGSVDRDGPRRRYCPLFSRDALFSIWEMFAIQTNCRPMIFIGSGVERVVGNTRRAIPSRFTDFAVQSEESRKEGSSMLYFARVVDIL
jgi:hypothetical protein